MLIILQLHLSPNRKYQPRIHVVEETEEGVKVSCSTYVFPETTFIAVTTYQNEEVRVCCIDTLNPAPSETAEFCTIFYKRYFKSDICNVPIRKAISVYARHVSV